MEIRVLRYFLTVAREQNFTRAAEVLHITQPTLSRQLMQLEKELSTQLFIREKNRIILTEEGMFLRGRAEAIVELADKTEKDFLMDEELINGEIYIGGGEANSMHILAKVMKQFKDTYPLVTFDLHSGNGDDIKEKIDQGRIDVGLLTEPIDLERYEFIRLRSKEVWGVLMRKDSPLSTQEYVTATDLIDKPLISTKRVIVQQELASWFGKEYEHLNVIATYNLIYNASIMVKEGLGYALSLENLIYIDAASELCFKPLYPALTINTVLVWKKHQLQTPTKAKFIEYIKNIYT